MARRTRAVAQSCPPPWLWIFAGMLIGASLTVLGYVYGVIPAPRQPVVVANAPQPAPATQTAPPSATQTSPVEKKEEAEKTPPQEDKKEDEKEDKPQIPRFEFYEVLPKPSQERQPRPDATTAVAPNDDAPEMRPEDFPPATESLDTPSSATAAGDQFMLQVASFRNAEEARQLQYYLSDLGFNASIQDATVNGEIWHRTRVGPYATQQAAEQARIRLREHQFKAIFVSY
jgi:cell division protein FtsN